MDETENIVSDDTNRSFSQNLMITQEHLNFILSKNKNKSEGLRQILDKNIEEEKNKNKINIIDRVLILSSMGFIFILISYLMDAVVRDIAIVIGVILITYSLVGGFIALQFSKKKQ